MKPAVKPPVKPVVPPVELAIADASPGERRLAVLRGGRPWRLVIEQDHRPSLLGDVHLARVLRLEPRIGAAFVDIGLEEAALLPLPRGGRRGSIPREGERFPVQVTAEPRDGKGPAVSRRIALPGRMLVLTIDRPGIAASQRLDPAEAARLQGLLRHLVGPDEGVVVRSGAAGADAETIEAELDGLRRHRRDIAGRAAAGRAGVLWRDVGPIGRCLRDELPAAVPLLVEGGAFLGALRAAGLAASTWSEPTPLFEAHGIDEEIEAARAVETAIPGGGTLAVEPTRALTALDVDGAGRPALEIDLAAAVEAARQIRLRNIGGQVVIDFVSLPDPPLRRQVDAMLDAGFAEDPADLRLEPMNRLGLAALSRQRLGPALHEIAPPGAADAAVLDGFRTLLRGLRRGESGRPILTVSSVAATLLAGPLAPARRAAEAALGQPLIVRCDPTLASGARHTEMRRT